MRIGLMLRAYGEKGGIGVYTRNLVRTLLSVDHSNEYVLFYQQAQYLGQYANRACVTERLVNGRNRAIWDQMAIPLACRGEDLDVLLHPKFTAPLLAPCPTVMVVHGADWFYPDQAQYYPWLDVRAMRVLMPLYFRKCAAVVSVSKLTTEDFERALGVRPGKIRTVYFGPAPHFQRITDQDTLNKVRQRYVLPDRFILHLTKRQGDGRKNLGQVLQAYARYHRQTTNAHKLVIGGQDCHLYRSEYGIPNQGYGGDILFPGWIDQEDLPAVYSLADLFLYPSNLEAFPIPVTEAMACGTPIITSNRNGLAEVAGEAAVLVDPADTEGIALAIARVLVDADLRNELAAKGRSRVQHFTWETCARQILTILEGAARN
jgi:glycosyltransferase involved in cell wall biosynthesis